jgi:hypothetical protein
MGLVYSKFKWIVSRVGRFTLFAGKPFRPWFAAFSVKCIGCGPYLEHYFIYTLALMSVQPVNHLLLLFANRQAWFAWPVNIFYGSDPYTPEFPFWW